jgi:hypothetical protein
MAMKKLGPWLYGMLFAVLLPIGLALWAAATATSVQLHAIYFPVLG